MVRGKDWFSFRYKIECGRVRRPCSPNSAACHRACFPASISRPSTDFSNLDFTSSRASRPTVSALAHSDYTLNSPSHPSRLTHSDGGYLLSYSLYEPAE